MIVVIGGPNQRRQRRRAARGPLSKTTFQKSHMTRRILAQKPKGSPRASAYGPPTANVRLAALMRPGRLPRPPGNQM
jgi:hypothetical protein